MKQMSRGGGLLQLRGESNRRRPWHEVEPLEEEIAELRSEISKLRGEMAEKDRSAGEATATLRAQLAETAAALEESEVRLRDAKTREQDLLEAGLTGAHSPRSPPRVVHSLVYSRLFDHRVPGTRLRSVVHSLVYFAVFFFLKLPSSLDTRLFQETLTTPPHTVKNPPSLVSLFRRRLLSPTNV